MEGKVIYARLRGEKLARSSARESWVMYCIVSSLAVEWVEAHKHKRENFLFLCDGFGDFARAGFLL